MTTPESVPSSPPANAAPPPAPAAPGGAPGAAPSAPGGGPPASGFGGRPGGGPLLVGARADRVEGLRVGAGHGAAVGAGDGTGRAGGFARSRLRESLLTTRMSTGCVATSPSRAKSNPPARPAHPRKTSGCWPRRSSGPVTSRCSPTLPNIASTSACVRVANRP